MSESNRWSVLDQGWVELRDVMGDDLAIVNDARTSYLGHSKGEKADKRLLFRLMKDKHTSPFEMVEFKIRAHAPVLVWWQWIRHRMASYDMQSGRYVEFEEKDFYVPETWRLQSENNKQASDGELEGPGAQLLSINLEHFYDLGYELYRKAIDDYSVAREQARVFLPGFATYYTGIYKVDAHNLMHFLRLRMADDAQWEIRQYAQVIYNNIFKPALPWTAEAFEKFSS